MIVVRYAGGLGNNLFQYAMGRSLEARGNEVFFDRQFIIGDPTKDTVYTYCLSSFNVIEKFSKPIDPWVTEESLRFNPKYFNMIHGTLNGYFQSEKYFLCIEDEIRKEVTLKAPVSDASAKIADSILHANNSVFLHIRRGDYLKPHNAAFHGVLTWDEYYKQAVEYICSNVDTPRFFIFSNDPQWCKENLCVPNGSIVDCNGYQKDGYVGQEREDMWLMSLCRHGITANSSFSWWGAWLGDKQRPRIVITPKKWFAINTPQTDSTDMVPDRWIRL